MPLKPKSVLSDDEIQQGLKYILKDGITSQVMVILTSGVFLVAFALKIGASNTIIGFLSAIPPLMQLIQLPSVYLVEKIRNRRIITVVAASISRIFWLLIAMIPFIFPVGSRKFFLILFLFFNTGFGAVGSSSWNSWMRDLIPQKQLGSFFSRRLALATLVAIILSIGAGYCIDCLKRQFPEKEIWAYSVLFTIAGISGLVGVYYLRRTPEPQMGSEMDKLNLLHRLREPFRQKNSRNLLFFLGAWNFAVNLASPFFTVYAIKQIKLDLFYIIDLTVFSQITSLVFFRIWGKFSDRYSNKSVLSVSGPLFMFCILAWTFTTMPEKHSLTIPLLIVIHFFMGLSTAGVNVGSGNIGLKLAPKGQATAFLAANSIVASLAAGTAPILGGKLVDLLDGYELSMTLKWLTPEDSFIIPTLNFRQWDFFFVLAFLIGTYSIHRLALVNEEGEVEEKIIVHELLAEVLRPLRTLTTVGGVQQLIQFPFSLIRNLIRSNKNNMH